MLALIALEFAGHPQQRAENHGAIIAGQVHDPGLDDEAAEFDQMSRALAALDLPGPHVMPRQRRLMPVVRRSIVVERRQRRGHVPMQIAAPGFEKTRHRAWLLRVCGWKAADSFRTLKFPESANFWLSRVLLDMIYYYNNNSLFSRIYDVIIYYERFRPATRKSPSCRRYPGGGRCRAHRRCGAGA